MIYQLPIEKNIGNLNNELNFDNFFGFVYCTITNNLEFPLLPSKKK